VFWPQRASSPKCALMAELRGVLKRASSVSALVMHGD
jgi:hypothetical protein